MKRIYYFLCFIGWRRVLDTVVLIGPREAWKFAEIVVEAKR